MSDNNPFTAPYSQAYTDAFTKLVPGFDFLQGLVKNAGQALPGIGQWVAPTLDPQELERRISELRTVQFWLEQNARMIATTVQALEVQRMTLGTLRTMNVPMADLGEALKVRVPDLFSATAAAAAPAPAPAPAPAATAGEAGAAPGAIDPMQWWGALTQQFTQLATQAMKATSEATAEAAAQASQAVQATTVAAAEAAAEAQARAADAVQDVMQSVAAAAPVAAAEPAPARKSAPRKAAAKKTTAAAGKTARAAKKST